MFKLAVVQTTHERKFKKVPIELIKSPAKPSREVYEDLKILAETIKRHGLLEPLLVKKLQNQYGFEVVCGERRFRACKRAKLQRVPCIIVDGVTEEQTLQMQLVENLQRCDLKVFEEIRIVQTLKDQFNLSNDEISIKTGLSSGTVANYLAIAQNLPEKYVKLISHGSHNSKAFTLTKALILARSNLSEEKLREFVDLITQKGLSRNGLAKKLAMSGQKKIKRVFQGRQFWHELTRSLKDFARYWNDYSVLREWDTPSEFHLELKVTMPKDLTEES